MFNNRTLATGIITVYLREVYSFYDLVLTGTSTTSDRLPLKPGCMFELRASDAN